MATNIQMRDFIALVTGGFMPLRDLIRKGQEIGLNASDAVEVITQLQPAMTPGNIMSNANMTSADPSTYVQPRIGFEEAVDFYNVPETEIGVGESSYEQQYRDPNPGFIVEPFDLDPTTIRVDPGRVGTGYFKDEFEEQNLDYNVGTGTPGTREYEQFLTPPPKPGIRVDPGEKGRIVPSQGPAPEPFQVSPIGRTGS